MPRNLDLAALRAFVTVAEVGGVTRAAAFLNLTQSAVSMQLKRLEESLGQTLFLRAARKLALSAEGEQLLSYGRRMLALNDEVIGRFAPCSCAGELRLGVPHDVVYPAIPGILKRLSQEFPRVRVNLVSSFTLPLKAAFERGEFDAIVTMEERPDAQAEVLSTRALIWAAAREGQIWQRRPLRLGFKDTCIFRPQAIAALDAAGIPWEMATGGESEQAVEATVAADLAVTVRMEGAVPEGMAPIPGETGLPKLGRTSVCLYRGAVRRDEAADRLLAELRLAYSG